MNKVIAQFKSFLSIDMKEYPTFSESLLKHRRNLLTISTLMIAHFHWGIEITSLPYITIPENSSALERLLAGIFFYMALMFLITALSEMCAYNKEEYQNAPLLLFLFVFIIIPIKLIKAFVTLKSVKSIHYLRGLLDICFPAILALIALYYYIIH